MKELEMGNKLRALRKINNLTTTQLAERIHISQSYISKFENNKASPDVYMLHRILTELGTDLSTFFADDNEDKSPEFYQLATTIKTLTHEQTIHLNAFLKTF